ncbi:hypothetical protein J7J18_07095 [bacterium]|nr:hypothetical protein [bacterium]
MRFILQRVCTTGEEEGYIVRTLYNKVYVIGVYITKVHIVRFILQRVCTTEEEGYIVRTHTS